MTRLEVSLAKQPGPLGIAAESWRRYTTEHLGSALQEVDGGIDLQGVVAGKIQSPLSAIVAALVLLRANRLDRLPQQWLENLSSWFVEYPDGPVLAAEALSRRQLPSAGRASTGKVADHLLTLLQRGVPRTAEAFEYAVGLTERLLKNDVISSDVRDRLHQLDALLDGVSHGYRPGGLFLSLSGLAPHDAPRLLSLEFVPIHG